MRSRMALLYLATAHAQAVDLIVSAGESVAMSAGDHSYDSCTIAGTLNVAGKFKLACTTFELQQGGKVLGTGMSHTSNGQGEGKGAGATAGASHGGLAYGSPQPYGVVKQPTTVGSGGGGTRGGAAIHISANTVTLNGLIASDGTYSTQSGGGSGGSVWIAAGVCDGPSPIPAALSTYGQRPPTHTRAHRRCAQRVWRNHPSAGCPRLLE